MAPPDSVLIGIDTRNANVHTQSHDFERVSKISDGRTAPRRARASIARARPFATPRALP
jgi:hypothetical protein